MLAVMVAQSLNAHGHILGSCLGRNGKGAYLHSSLSLGGAVKIHIHRACHAFHLTVKRE